MHAGIRGETHGKSGLGTSHNREREDCREQRSRAAPVDPLHLENGPACGARMWHQLSQNGEAPHMTSPGPTHRKMMSTVDTPFS